MAYGMTVIAAGSEIGFPVLPEKLEVTTAGKNETATVLELGEVLLLRKKGLRSVSWESFFPVNTAPFVTGRINRPAEAVKAIQKARDSLEPVRFLLTGTDLDVNIRMGIDSFDYEERSGELGDIYYSIKLTEWKDYSPSRLQLQSDGTAKAEEPARSGKPEIASEKTYTVQEGDCLWSIAQRIYGSGSDYTKLFDANRDIIGSNPNLIYPGQVFQIP